FAVSSAAAAGMAAWMIVSPSMLAPRYFLATPLLFALPAAAPAEILSRRHALLPLLVAPAVVVVIVVTPQHANATGGRVLYGLRTSLSDIVGPQGSCSDSAPFDIYCAAAEAIN